MLINKNIIRHRAEFNRVCSSQRVLQSFRNTKSFMPTTNPLE